MTRSDETLQSKSSSLVQATISTLLKKVEEKLFRLKMRTLKNSQAHCRILMEVMRIAMLLILNTTVVNMGGHKQIQASVGDIEQQKKNQCVSRDVRFCKCKVF
ncbi:hypothetical protein SLE2022_347500 [Rubroshorea leprosula]